MMQRLKSTTKTKKPLQPHINTIKPKTNKNDNKDVKTRVGQSRKTTRRQGRQSESKQRESKDKDKIKKNQKKKSRQKSSGKRGQQQVINMKQDLKLIISRNQQKHKAMVPDVLSNIQKNCKILRKIHQKQQKAGKSSNLVSNHTSKDKKQHPTNNKSHQMGRNTNKTSKDQFKSNRHSMIVPSSIPTPIPNQKSSSKADINILQLVKLYKKNFQIQEIKIDKSGKNTNYNTNQSRNSSSLMQSHGVGRDNQKSIQMKALKVQSLIRSQQNSASKEKESSRKQSRQCSREQNVQKQHSKQKNHEKTPSKDQRNSQQQKLMRQLFESQSSASKAMDRRQLQKRFQNSSYYVCPVPVENSLLGCSITLVEDNLIQEDSLGCQLEL